MIAGKMGGWERRGQAQGEGTGDGGFSDVWSERVEKGGWDSCM